MSSAAFFPSITKRLIAAGTYGAPHVLSVIACLIGALPSNAAEPPTRVGFTTFLREGPGLNYRPIDEALSGAEVEVAECGNGWCRIFYGGAYGYVAQRTLTTASREPPELKKPKCFDAALSAYHGSHTHRFCYSDDAAAKPR